MSGFLESLLIRAVRSSLLVDRGFRFFDRVRSKVVLAVANDSFYEAYNDIAYAGQSVYRAGNETFRSKLFPFEDRAIAQHFRGPPGAVLVGAAGGGREAFALADRGYQVVAFEPARPLVASLAQGCGDLQIEVFVGRYQELPMVQPLDGSVRDIDLRSRDQFAATILGLGSFSHLRSDDECIKALRAVGLLTCGPILLSYYPVLWSNSTSAPQFSAHIGYYRTFSGGQVRELAKCAGLKVIELDETDNWPYAVLEA
jgi:hypothetical protein